MGFRTEELYGEKHTNPINVISYEIFRLQNTDILETLANTILKDTKYEQSIRLMIESVQTNNEKDNIADTFYHNTDLAKNYCKELINIIEEITHRNIKYVLWLCDSIEDIINEYQLTEELTEFDEYENGPIILSDIGRAGKLYAYESMPNKIKTIHKHNTATISCHTCKEYIMRTDTCNICENYSEWHR